MGAVAAKDRGGNRKRFNKQTRCGSMGEENYGGRRNYVAQLR